MNAADILGGGARLVREQPKAIAIWAILYLIVIGALAALVWPLFAQMMQDQQQMMAAQLAGAPPQLPHLGGFFLAILGFDAVLLVLFAAIFAAAVRAVAIGGDDRFGFLRFGGDELRLIGLGIILVVIAFVAMIVIGIAVGVIAALAAVVGGGGSQPGAAPGAGTFALIFLLYLMLLAVMIWAEVRISLAGVYTVLRGRIVIAEAWRATRGRFWTLFGVYFLIFVAYTAVSLTLVMLMYPGMLGSYGQTMRGDPAAMQAMLAQQQAMMANLFGPHMLIAMLIGTLVSMVLIAFTFGAVATAAIGYDRNDHAGTDPA